MLQRFRNKEVDRDWLNSNFPCMMACPGGTHAGRYVALIAEGRFEEAYRYARDANPLASVCGRVCAHPCETACRRGAIDKPIQIRTLERLLTERYGPESASPLAVHHRSVAGQPFRIAVVGSGPVGLSAAHDLALVGYPVTIFEAAPVAGGMLRLGIPEYRLPRAVAEAQIREILAAGDITLRLNQAAGRDFTISGLRHQGFGAVVLAVGAHRSRKLSIPGVDLAGVHKGIDFLRDASLGYRFPIGRKVVVVGGGNVAVDSARTALRTGSEVLILYRRERKDMPAIEEETEAALDDGVKIEFLVSPRLIIGDTEGKVTAIEVVRTNSEFRIECDTIIAAIGQTPNLTFLKADPDIQISPQGLIVVDSATLMTNAPGVFAGGDCVFGPRLIIDSVGDGKRIARSVDEYLTGRRHPDPDVVVEVLDHREIRQPVRTMPLNRGVGFTEVEAGLDERAAMAEARRCLRCWINTGFGGSHDDGSRCILCGACVDACPEECLRLSPLDQIDFPHEVLDRIRQNQELFRVELNDVAAEELGVITGSVMLKDETRCIRCGLCAEHCPVGEITMEAYHFAPREAGESLQVRGVGKGD